MIRARLRRALPIAVALAIVGATPIARAIPTDPEAKQHLDKGNELFQAGDFDGAVEEYRKGYERQDDPAFLYTWAQAERRRGRCAAAIKLYTRYIETNPPDVSTEYAREGIVKCAGELAADAPMPPGDERADELDAPVDTVDTQPVEPPPPKPKDEDRWQRDPAAATLVALGAVGIGVGTGLLVASAVEKDKNSANYGEFDARLKKVRRFQIAGAIVLSIGVGVLAGGIARWAVLGSRAKKKNGSVSAMIGRGTAGLVFTRRF